VSLSYVTDSAGHIAMPVAGSYIQKRGCEPADPLVEAHYPIRAECRVCHKECELTSKNQMDWRHVRAKQVVLTADAP
jgi:hypothetical protein